MKTKITDHYFQYGTQKYFRSNAHLLELGKHGRKKDPIGPKSYLDPSGKIKASLLAERPILKSSVDINWASVSQNDLEAGVNLKFLGLGRKHGVSFDYKKAKSANLKLLNFSIDKNPLTRCLNNDANIVRNAMADEGNDARVVSEVYIVVEADLAEHFETQYENHNRWEAFGNSLDVTVSGGKYGSSTITIGPGTTVAYKLHKVRKWSKGKKKIEDMEAD
ncbi:MAG: hypothetical protein AB8B63_23305, partial [Granulosicoccus sp.]